MVAEKFHLTKNQERENVVAVFSQMAKYSHHGHEKRAIPSLYTQLQVLLQVFLGNPANPKRYNLNIKIKRLVILI